MRLAVVVNGIVTNVVEVSRDWSEESASWQPPKGSIGVLSDEAQIGDVYHEGVFISPTPLPPEIIVPPSISDRQFFQQLTVLGLITEAEALAAVKTGDIPAALQLLVDGLAPDQQFAATMLLSGATIFFRTHPLTVAFGFAFGWMPSQLDDLWIAASKL